MNRDIKKRNKLIIIIFLHLSFWLSIMLRCVFLLLKNNTVPAWKKDIYKYSEPVNNKSESLVYLFTGSLYL